MDDMVGLNLSFGRLGWSTVNFNGLTLTLGYVYIEFIKLTVILLKGINLGYFSPINPNANTL